MCGTRVMYGETCSHGLTDQRLSGTGLPHDIWLVVYRDDVNDHENVDNHKDVENHKDVDDHGDVKDHDDIDDDKGFSKLSLSKWLCIYGKTLKFFRKWAL